MHFDQRTLTADWKECITACFRCTQICEECSDDMIGMDPMGDPRLMERCIRLCRECADVCAMAGQWMSRLSPLAESMCSCCADVCDQCAEACEQYAPHHALCGLCAQECRRCAETCRGMSKRSAKAA